MRSVLFSTALAAGLALALSGCAGRDSHLSYNTQNFGAPDAPTLPGVDETYRIGPTDVLAVLVFNVPEFSGDFTVNDAGSIELPLIGMTNVTGLTTAEASQALKERLDKTYLKSPTVQVQIKTAASKRVTVDGAVTSPGVYPVASKSTLVQMIAMAHGTSESANIRQTVVFRSISGKRMAAAFDLADIRKGKAQDPDVFPGDIIVVQGSKIRQNLRDALSAVPLIALFTAF